MRPSRREHEDREREPSPRKSPFVNARTVFARLPVAFFFSCFFSPPRVSRTTRRAPQPLPPHRLTYRKSSTIAGLDLPRVQLLLSTTQAVLVAFARHPDRLASLLEEEDHDDEASTRFSSRGLTPRRQAPCPTPTTEEDVEEGDGGVTQGMRAASGAPE